ncbi:MAG TPA: twin-arginine translocase TatA/TatE family subunit [Bdellovibrionota bacterium]|jgi:sec-independent protein translocase protein TatA
MFGFSGEHLLVLLVILLIFGPKRLPDLGHSIGRTLKNFKDAMNGNALDSKPPSEQITNQQSKPAKTENAEKENERV